MKKTYLPLLLLLAATTLAGPASAELEDVNFPVTINPATSGFANTTGIQIGSYLYVYMQGDDGVEGGGDPDCFGTPGDRIIAYRALVTSGVPGTFSRVGRISPAAKAPTRDATLWDPPTNPSPNCTYPPAFFGPGQVFQATIGGVTKYHLLADVSDARIFRNVWHAESTDGISWSWTISGSGNSSQVENLTGGAGSYTITSTLGSAFLSSARTLSPFFLFNPILVSAAPATNNADWWGYLNYSDPTNKFTAMKVEWGTGSPVVKLLSGTSPSWTYTTISSSITSVPTALASHANVKTLLDEGGTMQAWGWRLMPNIYASNNVSCNTNTSIQCPPSTPLPGCPTADGSTVAPSAFGRPFWLNTGTIGDVTCATCNGSGVVWWPGVSTTSFGTGEQTLYSTVRSMPAGYPEARTYPFRWNSSTGRYLFSSTNDAHICTEFLFTPYDRTQVVRTTIVP